jgi:hypothetical protein
MAFGKKDKDEAPAAAVPAPDDVLAEAAAAVDVADEVDAVDAAEAEVTPEPVAETPVAPEASSTDALLSVFQTTQPEAEDITKLLDLAGDVAIDDLLEDLHTIAAALGIDTSPMASFDDDDDMLAA